MKLKVGLTSGCILTLTHTHTLVSRRSQLCASHNNHELRLSSPSPGIPLLCFLVLLPLNIPWSQISVTWLGVVHFLACLSPQLGSVVYHLFMNHEGGEPVYHTLLKLDVCGICMINTLGEASALPFAVLVFSHRFSSFLSSSLLSAAPSALGVFWVIDWSWLTSFS